MAKGKMAEAGDARAGVGAGHAAAADHGRNGKARPTAAQKAWLMRGLDQPGGKLPLFDEGGQRVNALTIRSCIDQGWAEPWFANPVKPDWLVCKLTDTGRVVLGRS